MAIRVTGGVHARIEVSMPIFQNGNCSHPIRGVPDDAACACYHSGRKGWMDAGVFVEWLAESKAIRRKIYRFNRTFFVEKCSAQTANQAVNKSLYAQQLW